MDKRKTDRDNSGHLMIIGGGESRNSDMHVLERFVDLAGGKDKKIAVLTAASTLHSEMWEVYDKAFSKLGVKNRFPLMINTRKEANDPKKAQALLESGGVFMTGGDQSRLLALIGGTETDAAMLKTFKEHGSCIAGTSAGASAISEHMLVSGPSGALPQKGTTYLAAGLGFLNRVVIDQHFSERQRLGRLMGVIAQNPYLLGLGIDENTALIVKLRSRIEIIGDGAVTVIDGRDMTSNFLKVGERELLELTNLKVHLLPSGANYEVRSDKNAANEAPESLIEAVATITESTL
jgi:cyanophycinase